jgi:hypothetical protein
MSHKTADAVAERWQANFDARMDWAFEAYGRLVASLSDDVSSTMASAHPEAYVVVFGRTQVGKTTLLLELMGVSANSMNRVSKVLRGGRVKGQSATATAMEYGRAIDAHWVLQLPNQQPEHFPDDVQACAALGAIRQMMETRQLQLNGPVRLEIPCDCFQPVQEGHARVRMLDLPGDQASNPVEQQYVAQIAERFVAGADLILLVGKMDDLSFLKPGGLVLPGIEDWQIVPERFRIVTTYSFTAGSVQAAVRKHGLRVEHLRQRLIEQLETFGSLGAEARRPELFFPLEFGQSIERAAKHAPELVEKIKPVVDELKAQLAHQIKTATTPMARLRSVLRSHLTVAKLKEHKLSGMDAELNVLHSRVKAARAALDVAKKVAESNSKRHTRLTHRQEQLVCAKPKASVAVICALEASQHVAALSRCDKNVKSLQSCIDDFRAWLRESYLALDASVVGESAELSWFWRNIRPPLEQDLPAIRELLDVHFCSIESRFQRYWSNGYWFDSSFEQDSATIREAMRAATSRCRELAARRWRSAIDRKIKAHDKACLESLSELSIDEKLLRELKLKAKAAEQTLRRMEKVRVDFDSRMVADQERCLAFTKLLDESYQRQLETMMSRFHGCNDPSHALVELISCAHLIEIRAQMLATGLPTCDAHQQQAH